MRMFAPKHLWFAGTAIVCIVFGVQLSVLAKRQEPKTYPERGVVIDSYADTHGGAYTGSSARKVTPIFRVETDTKVYEIESKKKTLTEGDTVEFRIDNDWVYVKNGDKEEKFRLVDTEPRPPKFYK